MALEEAGLQLIAKDVNQYISNINQAAKAETDLGKASVEAAQKAEKHASAITSLNSKIALQKQQFDLLTRQLLESNAKYGEGSIQSGKLDLAMQRLAVSVSENERKLDGEKKALHDEMAAQTAASATAASATQVVDKLGDESQQTGQQIEKAGKEVETSGGHFSAFREIVVGALREIGSVAVDALGNAAKALGGFLKDAVTDAGTFEQGLNVLQAVTGATDQQMSALSKTAIALGNDISLPGTSAQDAATAMTELAKAGLSTQDAMDAAKGTLLLATAAETSAGVAAAITAGALNTFHLAGSQAAVIADQLAAGANASAASITDLSQGMRQAGFIFYATGQKSDDLIASLGILTNVGLTGSDAGTALKNAMTRLINPTKNAAKLMAALGINVYDVQGKMLPMRDIIGVLQRSLGGMTDEQRNAALSTIFLSDGMKAMIPILDAGVAGFDAMKTKVNQVGAAQGLAGAQTMGFTGSTAALGNALDTLKLIIGTQLLPLLTPLINQVASAVGVFGTLIQAITGDNDALNTLSPTLQNIVRYINSVVSAYNLWQAGTISLRTALDVLSPGLGDLVPVISQVIGVIQTVIGSFQQGGAGATVLGAYITALQGRWAVLLPAITSVVNGISAVVLAVFGQVQTFLDAHGAEIYAVISNAWNKINAIVNDVITIVGMVVGAGLQTIAGYITEHGAQIQAVLSTAWDFIATTITTTLDLISGVVHFVLQALQGDWKGAHDTLLQTSVNFVMGLKDVIITGLNFIASFFGTSLDGIVATWRGNWDMMVQIAMKIPGLLKNVGTAIVGIISDGFSNAWDDFMGRVRRKLQELQDMLPFSEPKDSSSPLYGLSKSGAAIISQIQQGIDSSSLTLPASIIGYDPGTGGIGSDQKKESGSAPDLSRYGGTSEFPQSNQAATLAAYLDWIMRLSLGSVTPDTSASNMASNASTSYSNTTTLNMPIYTNQSPGVLQSSMAIAGAALP